MQKFYKVTSESKLWKDYLEYKKNSDEINEIYRRFSKGHDIESTQYYPTTSVLYIVPTEKDKKTFKNQLTKKELDGGLRRFRANSKINQSWVNTLEKLHLQVIRKPYVPFYFKNVYGRIRTMIFAINDNVYCSIEMEQDFDTPIGFKEIKGSEFYKIIEDYNNAIEGEQDNE